MEITLDSGYIRGILSAEHSAAQQDLQHFGPIEALARSQIRHDERLRSAPGSGTLACRAGCAWCCYFTVDVRAVEVFRILERVEHAFSALQLARLREEVTANAAALRELDDLDRMRRNVKCPFLDEARCTIYEVRPQTCRNYHATSALGCQASYENPYDLDIDPEFAPYVYQAGGAHVDAFTRALKEAGYDTDVYELNAALEAALSDPQARARFEAKDKPFIGLAGRDVPPEFDESD